MKRNRDLLKISALVLLLLLLVCVLIGCDDGGEGEGEPSEPPEQSVETDPIKEEVFRIVENGVANFTIVAPEKATDGESEAFSLIWSKVAEFTGVSLAFSDDWIRDGEEHDEEAYEILIGQTNYKETQEVLNETSYGSYTITVKGRKLIVTAWSEEGIQKAAEALVEILGQSLSGKDLIVETAKLSASRRVDRTLDDVPVVPNLKIDHIYDANNASEIIYSNATPEHFTAYVEKLERDGYEKYAENARGQVLSAIFTDRKDYIFTVFYEGAYDELCVLVEEYSRKILPPKAKEYKKVCETAFAQVGLEYKYGSSTPQNGMCYVWRLEDGRFIILDGGFNYKLGADNLYQVLEGLAVNPNDIEIASWVISHFHGDHVGTLVKFVQNYLYDARIDSLLFNLPTKEQSAMSDMNWSSWNTISGLLGKYNSSLAVYTAHPGQIYHFANAELEILYTLEMYAPKDLTYYNTCSLIVDVKFGDFNMMMLGDCSDDANVNLCNNYGDALESEVVQVAHHGYQGGTTAFYRHIDPIYVFWPAGGTWYGTCADNVSEGADSNRNAFFFMENTRIKSTFVARATVIVLTIEKDVGFTDCATYENVKAFCDGDGIYNKFK